MANEALLKADLIDILKNTFQMNNFNQAQSYKTLLDQFRDTINGYMDSIEFKATEQTINLLCRLAPHYVQIDAKMAGQYLVRAIDKGHEKLCLALINNDADLTAATEYKATPLSMAQSKSATVIVNAIKQKMMVSNVTQSFNQFGISAAPSKTAATSNPRCCVTL